jgi:transketolase
MRNTFIKSLCALAEKDERIVFLTADLGYTVVEPFQQQFPKRFFNVGVAEQNMVGLATALAKEGFIPFVYSIANFAALRPYEFIRNGPIQHQVPVKIIGVGSGFDYGPAGITHYNLEDVGTLRVQKGLTIAVPADKSHIEEMLEATYALPSPTYYRIAKGEATSIEAFKDNFDLKKVVQLSKGKDMAFVCMGGIVGEVLKASELLLDQGIFSSVFVVHNFNPSPDEDLIRKIKNFPLVVTVEDHYINGGLGSFVCELVAERSLKTTVKRIGVDTQTVHITGSRSFMNDHFGLSARKISQTAHHSLKLLAHEKSPILDHSSYSQTV